MPLRRNILITGASSGLGRGMAREFAKLGRNLALCARRTERLEELQRELTQAYPGVRVAIRALDVNDYDKVFEVFRSFHEELGSLDRIIVNAGLGKGQPLGTGFFYANRQTAETNFVAALAQCEAAVELFRKQGEGLHGVGDDRDALAPDEVAGDRERRRATAQEDGVAFLHQRSRESADAVLRVRRQPAPLVVGAVDR